MADWGLIAIRFALYADLMLLVGLSAFPLYSFTRAEREARIILPLGAVLAWLAIAGLLFSVAGFTIASAAMMGVPPTDIGIPMLVSMASGTAFGTAWVVRLVALAALLLGLLLVRRSQTARLAVTLAGSTVALATLLWSGHAGASEGALGTAHRVSDITHMVAAAFWLGGIISFCIILASLPGKQDANKGVVAARALANFSRVGTALVALIVITGIFNRLIISGTDALSLVQSTYGLLLTAKVLLFAVMLGLAANNRWKLAPALEQALCGDNVNTAWRRLRVSAGLEAAAGATVLILVAWLGTLSPV